MSLPRYPEYKESGVKWLGQVPSHWTTMRLKILLEETDSRAGELNAELLGLSKTLGVVKRSELEQGAAESDDYSKYKLIYPGQLVMNKMQAWNGVFGLSRYYGKVSPDYATFKFLKPATSEFLSLLFRTDLMAGVFYTRCRGMGTAFLRINTGDFLDIKIPMPPIAEIHFIAEFLDRETAKIDRLIAEQEKLIALLAEKRQATISHAVTRGLNPTAPMKDSGVEWLGEVPEHWEVTRLKFVAAVQTGIAKGKDMSGKETTTVPYLRVANVQDGFLTLGDIATLDIEPEQLDRYRLIPGDVLMNEGGDYDKLGRGTIWRGEIQDCIHQNHVFAVRPHSVDSNWLNRITSSQYAQFYFMGRSKQSTNLASISSSNIMELPVLLPPNDEQQSILTFLSTETTKLDTLKSEVTRAIELLKERRSALIAAAVTGQIDVRNAVAQPAEQEEAVAL